MAQIKRFRWAWLLVAAFSWPGICLGAASSGTSAEGGVLTRVVSVKAKTTDQETVLTVKGNGRIPEYSWETFADPPRIVVDLPCASQGFESRSIALNSPNLDRVRIGHHPDRVRLVFDVKGFSVPPFSMRKEKESLVLRVSLGKEPVPRVQHDAPVPSVPQHSPVPEPQEGGEGQEEGRAAEKPTTSPSTKEIVATEEDRHERKNTPSRLEKLLEVKNPDTHPETVLLRRGIEAFRAQRWVVAIESFRFLLEQNPGSRYAERASFLLAKSCDRGKDSSVSSHAIDAQSLYDVFLSRYPSSEYAADALVAKGHLSLELGHHEEAIGYYGLAFSRDKDSPAAAEALAGKMKVLILKRQFDDALAVSRHILQHFPQSAEALDARLEMAKLFHEMNRFKESLAALTSLDVRDKRIVYLRPEICLYAGYNAYELGRFPEARENLLRYYNTSPAAKESPLALAKIGDTYREEKLFDHAAKIYQWTTERHPDSEGALISRIRLAELEEQGQGKGREKGPGLNGQPGGGSLSPREAYENILKTSSLKEADNPLVALAHIKLAVLYQKQEEYGKSLAMVKELLKRFRGQQLQKETDHLLFKALRGTITQSLQAKDYLKTIHFYYEEKDLFSRINSPELFLAVARAFLKLDLREDASELFKTAGAFLPDEEKPADLLYFLAWDHHRRNDPDLALQKLKAAIDRAEDKEYVCRAHQLRGKILLRQKQWDKALEAFASALKHSPEACVHLEVLTERASAMASCGMKDAALQSIRQAKDLRNGCAKVPLPVLENLGDVLFLLGRNDEDLALLQEEAGKEENRKDLERLKWRLAQYHESLGQKESSQAVYQQLTQLDDPLWRRLANDKMEEIRFRQDMESFRKP